MGKWRPWALSGRPADRTRVPHAPTLEPNRHDQGEQQGAKSRCINSTDIRLGIHRQECSGKRTARHVALEPSLGRYQAASTHRQHGDRAKQIDRDLHECAIVVLKAEPGAEPDDNAGAEHRQRVLSDQDQRRGPARPQPRQRRSGSRGRIARSAPGSRSAATGTSWSCPRHDEAAPDADRDTISSGADTVRSPPLPRRPEPPSGRRRHRPARATEAIASARMPAAHR